MDSHEEQSPVETGDLMVGLDWAGQVWYCNWAALQFAYFFHSTNIILLILKVP